MWNNYEKLKSNLEYKMPFNIKTNKYEINLLLLNANIYIYIYIYYL